MEKNSKIDLHTYVWLIFDKDRKAVQQKVKKKSATFSINIVELDFHTQNRTLI